MGRTSHPSAAERTTRTSQAKSRTAGTCMGCGRWFSGVREFDAHLLARIVHKVDKNGNPYDDEVITHL